MPELFPKSIVVGTAAGRVIGIDLREDRRQEAEDAVRLGRTSSSLPILQGALDAGSAYFVECLTTLSLEEMDDLIEREKQIGDHYEFDREKVRRARRTGLSSKASGS